MTLGIVMYLIGFVVALVVLRLMYDDNSMASMAVLSWIALTYIGIIYMAVWYYNRKDLRKRNEPALPKLYTREEVVELLMQYRRDAWEHGSTYMMLHKWIEANVPETEVPEG